MTSPALNTTAELANRMSEAAARSFFAINTPEKPAAYAAYLAARDTYEAACSAAGVAAYATYSED